MKHLIVTLLLGSAACQCRAEDFSQPINLFVKRLFQGTEIQADFREMWISTPEASPSRRDPNGGYLFRFQLQFEGGNDTLVFVASDRFGDVRRDAPAWSIYQRTQQNSWRLVSTGEMLQSGGISVHHPSRTIIQAFPDRFDEGKTFVTLHINTSGSTEKKRYRSEEISGDVKETIEKAVVPGVLKIEKIPLIMYLRSPQMKWRPISEHGMAAQSLDPEDAPLLASTSNVGWNEALKLLDALPKLSSNAPINPLKSEPRSMANPSPLVQPHAPQKPVESKSTQTPSEEPASSTPWSIIVVLIVAATGLLWLLVKSRK